VAIFKKSSCGLPQKEQVSFIQWNLFVEQRIIILKIIFAVLNEIVNTKKLSVCVYVCV